MNKTNLVMGLGCGAILVGLVVTNARVRELERELVRVRERRSAPPAEAARDGSTAAEIPPPRETRRDAALDGPREEARPSFAPATDGPAFREAVTRVLEEIRREEDAKWDRRVRKAGVDLLSKELGLNRAQEELITPIVEEHLRDIQTYWWPGTVRGDDGQDRALGYDEKVKLSDEARKRVDERVRMILGGAQSAAYQDWVRTWREEAPKRAGEVGPLRWY